MYDYAIRFEQDDSAPGVAVFCRDLPELNSYGDDREHAIREAVDAIETTLSIYVKERRAIPQASDPEDGEHVVRLPAVTVAKIALWNEMIKRDMRKADLCRLLGIAQTQGDRLVDFLHNTQMEALESALAALHSEVRVTPPDPNWISLRYGGAQAGFYVGRLVDEFNRRGISEMPTGATKGNLDSVNQDSLDYLLRTRYARNPNTMQAVLEVYQQLEATGLFEYLPKEPGVRSAGVLRLV
ncbi:type II toxin-antitoxin system HicB family antitoxin [Pseudomonas panipatensis]|uniref:Predicted nuclease of the RNAse H fold, HicB family n=1 Tax=Pseudomonas panipatensis TaxID=428992 RepID=A0A1G8HJV9_9PSED|nr:Predicted nuclease of the RNAse H fold, HicB family [Pseudomonas panipatensis]SMP58672.1 Predicted nuclease of the RNAse H fold, HicB family [Pseudomonas panipatensis]